MVHHKKSALPENIAHPLISARVPIKELEKCEITVDAARKIREGRSKSQKTNGEIPKLNNDQQNKTPRKKGTLATPNFSPKKANDANQGTPSKSANRGTPKNPFFEVHKCEGKLGVLRMNKRNFAEAYVRFDAEPDVFILGTKHRNRALDGDSVYVEMLQGKELEKAKLESEEQSKKRFNDNMARQVKVDLEKQDYDYEPGKERIFGKIVGIAKSNAYKQVHPGYLTWSRPFSDSPPSEKFVWFQPVGNRIPFVQVTKQSIPTSILTDIKNGNQSILYKVKIQSWNEMNQFPLGKYIGKIGEVGELSTESESLLVANDISWDEFSDKVLQGLVPTPWSIPESEYSTRLDLREECIFSIDPPTARDLDDALSCQSLPNGNYRVGVHIADVSYFVKDGSVVDHEAFNRGTSVYLSQRVIPMLPRLLCEELCSLNPGVERLAFSVFWTFSNDGTILGEPEFTKSVIKSCGKLWYDHAQQVIDGKEFTGKVVGGWSVDQVKQKIQNLYKLSKILRQQRYDNGALSLNSIKLWFKLDDNGNPIDTGVYELKDSNRLIEEFMLLANMAVAKRIATKFPDTALLRRHRPPVPDSISKKMELLNKCGFHINATDSQALDESLKEIGGTQEKFIRLMLIKSMKRADYFCKGSVELSEAGHYALSVPLYTHFTSPIRRYCDLIVHRQLEASFTNSELYTTEMVSKFAERCNERKNQAKDAQDASQNLFLCVFMRAKLVADKLEHFILPATIVGVDSRALDVVVDEIGFEARAFLEDSVAEGICTGVSFNIEENILMVRWKNEDQHLKLFDKIVVKIWPDFTNSPPKILCRAVSPDTALVHWNTAAEGKVLYPELDLEG